MKTFLQNSVSQKICSVFFLLILIGISTRCYPQFSFTLEGPITITGNTFDITVGNFDNAGRKEAIVTHAQNYNNTTPSSSNIVTYIKYDSISSTWVSSVIENTGGYASLSITSGDYDSDGNRDFAFTANCNCGNYYLYKGDGADGFTNATPTFSGNRFAYDMETGDLNNDSKPDILTGGNTVLSKFLNTSAGVNNFSFSKTSFIIPSPDNSSYGYSMADFNGDGFLDIVATVPGYANVRVLLNDGTGGFNSAVYVDYTIAGSSSSNIRGVATGDFNEDGYPDIVAASYTGNAIGILIDSATGTGTFMPVVLYSIIAPQWVEVGDLDVDGHLDIAVSTTGGISIFSGNGDGTFAASPYVYSFSGAKRFAISDINNDGRDDIAAVNANSFIALINLSGNYYLQVADSLCYGGSYTFPDGSIENNITSQLVHTSHLLTTVHSYDSIIETTVHVNPVYNLAVTDSICSGGSYTFPDGTVQNNITAQVIHTSNLFTAGTMCDSVIETTLYVNPSYYISETDSVCPGGSYTFPDGTTQSNITAQIIHTSNFYTAGTMCDSIIETTIKINPVYNLTETDSVCKGESYTFPDGTVENNITAQVIHTSNLQTTGTLCDSIIITTINIRNVVTTVTVNGSTITADAMAASYQWLDCDNGYAEISGEVNQSFTPSVNGNYAVEITQNTCVDTSVCTSVLNTVIIDNGFGTRTRLYPNPSDGFVNVVYDKAFENIRIVIKDPAGRVLGNQNFEKQEMISLNLPEASGVYFIEIYTESEKAVYKIVRE